VSGASHVRTRTRRQDRKHLAHLYYGSIVRFKGNLALIDHDIDAWAVNPSLGHATCNSLRPGLVFSITTIRPAPHSIASQTPPDLVLVRRVRRVRFIPCFVSDSCFSIRTTVLADPTAIEELLLGNRDFYIDRT
jgi:hypothetical protein